MFVNKFSERRDRQGPRLLRRSERGQVILIFIVAVFITAVMAAITIDVGLWYSERRGAQRDADLSALAGARELAVINPGSAEEASAEGIAGSWLEDRNNIGNSSLRNPVLVDDSCFAEFEVPGSPYADRAGVPDSVRVDADRDTAALFFKVFGIDEAEVGATAKACVGAAEGTPKNLVPLQVDLQGPCFTAGRPDFTAMCILELESQGGNPRGVVDMDIQNPVNGDECGDAQGVTNLEELLRLGADNTCLINRTANQTCDPTTLGPWYDCVGIQTGNARDIVEGLRDRIMGTQTNVGEGLCDSDGNTIDDFDESVELLSGDWNDPANSLFAPKDCDEDEPGMQISPRLITIFVFPDAPIPGNDGYPNIAFAGFRIQGCGYDKNDDGQYTDSSDRQLDEFNPKCDVLGGQGGFPAGRVDVLGEFVNLLYEDQGTGPVAPGTTAFAISLVE